MAGTGRKSKYDEFIRPHLARIEHLCRMGATEEEICRKFSVSVSAFNVYKNQHPELVEALKRGKVDADDAVEVPPDVTAAIFWLKNRRPERWRDRHELGIEGGNIPIKLIEEEKNL